MPSDSTPFSRFQLVHVLLTRYSPQGWRKSGNLLRKNEIVAAMAGGYDVFVEERSPGPTTKWMCHVV
jgi:hypothetical protein